MTDDVKNMSNDDLIAEYTAPGLQLLAHPCCEEILNELKERGIFKRAKDIAHENARDHVVKHGTYRT